MEILMLFTAYEPETVITGLISMLYLPTFLSCFDQHHFILHCPRRFYPFWFYHQFSLMAHRPLSVSFSLLLTLMLLLFFQHSSAYILHENQRQTNHSKKMHRKSPPTVTNKLLIPSIFMAPFSTCIVQ